MPDLYAQQVKAYEQDQTKAAKKRKTATQDAAEEQSRLAQLQSIANLGKLTPAQIKTLSVDPATGGIMGQISQSLFGRDIAPEELTHEQLLQVANDAQWRLSNRAEARGEPTTERVPLNVGPALQQAEQPYTNELKNLVSGAPSLSEYLGGVPSGIAGTLQQGYGNELSALAGMAPAVNQAAQQAGNAGLLADLLNAARYQAIYKQNAYGAPPSGASPLGELYNQVVLQGGALSGNLPGLSPTQAPKPKTGTLSGIPS